MPRAHSTVNRRPRNSACRWLRASLSKSQRHWFKRNTSATNVVAASRVPVPHLRIPWVRSCFMKAQANTKQTGDNGTDAFAQIALLMANAAHSFFAASGGRHGSSASGYTKSVAPFAPALLPKSVYHILAQSNCPKRLCKGHLAPEEPSKWNFRAPPVLSRGGGCRSKLVSVNWRSTSTATARTHSN